MPARLPWRFVNKMPYDEGLMTYTTLVDTLTRTQNECTRLLEENRELRKIITALQYDWFENNDDKEYEAQQRKKLRLDDLCG